jgi:hypothetical protein
MVKGKLSRIFFFLFIILLLALGYFYFFELSPTFVNKPQMEKPDNLAETINIDFTHISYILNELGAYKLHEDPFTGEKPVIELQVEDTGQEFFVQIDDEKFSEIGAGKADIKISAKKETILGLFAGSIDKGVVSAVAEGSMKLEVISDEKTLALKGYKSIYDSLKNNAITGNVPGALNPVSFIRGLEIFLFLLFALTVAMIIEKEI